VSPKGGAGPERTEKKKREGAAYEGLRGSVTVPKGDKDEKCLVRGRRWLRAGGGGGTNKEKGGDAPKGGGGKLPENVQTKRRERVPRG